MMATAFHFSTLNNQVAQYEAQLTLQTVRENLSSLQLQTSRPATVVNAKKINHN